MTESDKTTKKCTSCEEELELDKFSILNSKKGTRNILVNILIHSLYYCYICVVL